MARAKTLLPVPEAPARSTTTIEASSASAGSAVVYVGRIPHGFYESQMQAYFSQFGTIRRLRLSRNRRTAASKHYAFIEFESPAVARIVAETMDQYLLFGHLLQVKIVPEDKVHEDLWKGADKRFKIVPWRRITKRQMELTESTPLASRVNRARKHVKEAEQKWQAKGIDYHFEIPENKSMSEQ